MRIVMVGTGYVGLVSGTCFAEFGIDVVCVDKDPAKIKKLQKAQATIYEPGLEDLLERGIKTKRLSFTSDLNAAMKGADVVFICVGTPSDEETGHADLSYVHRAAEDIAMAMDGYTVVVNKSTVPVGTSRTVENIIKENAPDAEFDVVSNPEFLREGMAINDFMRPDRIVVGTDSERAEEVMRALYKPLGIYDVPLVFTGRETAEIIKYACNAFLATKITFINEIANLCEETGGDVEDVAKAMGLDNRISNKFLRAGPGYGGSCFPKDMIALSKTGQLVHTPLKIVESVINVNAERHKQMTDKIIKTCGGDVSGLTIGILGLSFKPNTDDMRGSSSLSIIPDLQKAGAKIKAYDPAAMDIAKTMLENIIWENNPYSVADGADALVILTEWNEFRAMHLDRIHEIMNTRRLIDLRNVYKLKDMEDRGFHYVSVGRPEIHGEKAAALKEVARS